MIDERQLVRRAIELLEERKAENIVVIDLNDVAIPTSYFVIAETDNTAHVKALVNVLRKGMPSKPRHSEGFVERRWVVLDYGDFVVHVFDREAREFYDIESLWADHIVERNVLAA
ncbi:ribosome silencing factor [Candidatus Bipolaricaulota bacterium]